MVNYQTDLKETVDSVGEFDLHKENRPVTKDSIVSSISKSSIGSQPKWRAPKHPLSNCSCLEATVQRWSASRNVNTLSGVGKSQLVPVRFFIA